VVDFNGGFDMTKFVSRFFKDESGATAIEYGLIATFIAVAIIAGAQALGVNLNSMFDGVAGQIAS
jgi:pilus assembly protein Flp/PilA